MIYAVLQMLSLIFGHIIIKHALNVDPNPLQTLTIMYICSLIAVIASLAFIPSLRQQAAELKHHWRILLSFVFLNLFNSACFYFALIIIGLGGISILGNTTPVLMILSGYFIFKERLTKPQIALTFNTLTAALLFSLSSTTGHSDYLAIFLYLMANTSWVAMNIMVKKFPPQITGMGLVIARIPFLTLSYILIFAAFTHYEITPPLSSDYSALNIIMIALASILILIIPYALFPIAMKHTDMTMMGLIKAIQPMIGFAAAIVIFSEPMDTAKIAAAALAICGGLLYSGHLYIAKKNRPVIPPR